MALRKGWWGGGPAPFQYEFCGCLLRDAGCGPEYRAAKCLKFPLSLAFSHVVEKLTPPHLVTQGHSLLKYRDELLWGGSKCTGAHHRNHLGNKGYSLFLSPFASVQKGRPHHKDLHLWMSLEWGCLIPWYQSGLAVISGRSFAWILMVYWTRDYPCAINQLNRQVASHPLNKSPLIFNKQAIASVKWIYRENFGDTSIAGLLMAYTGLWVTTDWHFSFILILPLWLCWLNTNIEHFNWSAKCHRSDAEYCFFSIFPNYKGLWFWISPSSFIGLESQASKHELSLIGTQCWKHCLFVEFLHCQDPWLIVGAIFLCPRANCW